MEVQYFYRKDTLQIDAVNVDCKTNSSKFKDMEIYVEVNEFNPPYMLSRDHKVVLASDVVIDTVYNLNPKVPDYPVELPCCAHFGVITSIDPGRAKPLYATITFKNKAFPKRCLVSSRLVELFLDGSLNPGDYVIIQFLENSLDNPIAVSKVYKSW